MSTTQNPPAPDETQLLIDRYFQNELTATELSQFETRMKTDAAFRKTVAETQLLIAGIEEHALRGQLQSFHKEAEQKPQHKIRRRRPWAIAASLLVLIGISAWLVVFDKSPAERLFAENFKPDPGLPTTMSTTANYAFFEGMVSYKRENYKEAIAQWEPLFADDPANDTLAYFLGVAHLANKEIPQAENYLTIAEMQGQSIFYEEAKYYLALAQLKADKPKVAEKTLKEAKLPKSRELLNALKNIE